MKSGAVFSEDRKYRYCLWRDWDTNKPVLGFCMLNPSTADEIKNDPTIERCERRAKMLGYGGIVIVNVFAYRSTDPAALKTVDDPVGFENMYHIRKAARSCKAIVCGWGKHAGEHGKKVLSVIRRNGGTALALKINKDGSPSHPLYIGYDVKPIPIDINP